MMEFQLTAINSMNGYTLWHCVRWWGWHALFTLSPSLFLCVCLCASLKEFSFTFSAHPLWQRHFTVHCMPCWKFSFLTLRVPFWSHARFFLSLFPLCHIDGGFIWKMHFHVRCGVTDRRSIDWKSWGWIGFGLFVQMKLRCNVCCLWH